MTAEEAYEKYPSLKMLPNQDLVALLEAAQAQDDKPFAEAIQAILKSQREDNSDSSY